MPRRLQPTAGQGRHSLWHSELGNVRFPLLLIQSFVLVPRTVWRSASSGLKYATWRGCAHKTYPCVYSRVSENFDWIWEQICVHSRYVPDWAECSAEKVCRVQGPNFSSNGVRIPGVDWPLRLGHSSSAEDCAWRCEGHPACEGFHYYGPEDGYPDAPGHCYLKKHVSSVQAMSDNRDRYAYVCTMVGKVCRVQGPSFSSNGIWIPGVDWPLRLSHSSTAKDCARHCEGLPACKGFHYYGAENSHPYACGHCYLKKM